MSQSSNRIFWWLKILLLISLPLIFLAVAAWIGGAIFMAGNGYEAKDATPLTLYQYWYYYGDIPKTKLSLMGSMVGGLVITALPCLLPLLPKKTPLHGNARWAN